MEIDALLLLILSLLVWQTGQAGAWVLAIGLMRYAFVAASWFCARLAAPLHPSFRRKTVCALQGIALLACLLPPLDQTMGSVIALTALSALVISFGTRHQGFAAKPVVGSATSEPDPSVPGRAIRGRTLDHDPNAYHIRTRRQVAANLPAKEGPHRRREASKGSRNALMSPDLNDRSTADSMSMVSVNRAVADLRRGSFVVIESRGEIRPCPGGGNGHHRKACSCSAAPARASRAWRSPPIVPGCSISPHHRQRVVLLADHQLVQCRHGALSGRSNPRDKRPHAASCHSRSPCRKPTRTAAHPRQSASPSSPKCCRPRSPFRWRATGSSRLNGSAANHDLPTVEADAIARYTALSADTLLPVTEARLPIASAENARIIGFRPANGGAEHFAIVVGDPGGPSTRPLPPALGMLYRRHPRFDALRLRTAAQPGAGADRRCRPWRASLSRP